MLQPVPVWLNNTRNLSPALVLQVLPVWLAACSRFRKGFHRWSLRLPVPPLRCFRPRNLLIRCHNTHLPGTLLWCSLPILPPGLLPLHPHKPAIGILLQRLLIKAMFFTQNGTQIWRPFMRTILLTGNRYLMRMFWMLPPVQELIQQSWSPAAVRT